MDEKLIIHNFAGIKDIEMDVGKINILIGPQATGKSVCAKLLYFFKKFCFELFYYVYTQASKTEFDIRIKYKFETYFPKQSLAKDDFNIEYHFNESFIKLTQSTGAKSKLVLNYSEDFLKVVKHLKNFNKKYQNANKSFDDIVNYIELKNEFNTYISSLIGDIFSYDQYFIPAGRSFFANLQGNIFSFISNNNALDPFLAEFGSFYENYKDSPSLRISAVTSEISDSNHKIEKLVQKILCGKYLREKGKDFLIFEDGRKTNISYSSSGQQEVLPLAIILKVLLFTKYSSGKSVYLEEPEAHLFPTAQKNVVDLLALVFNESKMPVQLFITTHSPYILTSFNNLLTAGQILKTLPEEKKEKLYSIVPKEQIIDPDDIRVYSLSDGVCTNIFDRKEGLIRANVIDDVSEEISVQFDELLDLGI